MTKTAFNRDNVLSDDDRLKSARKCLALLTAETASMGEREAAFVEEMSEKLERWGCSERQLAWLRDLVTKYAN